MLSNLRRMKCLQGIVHSAFVWLFLSLPLIAQQTLKPFEEQYPALKRVDNLERFSLERGLSDPAVRGNMIVDSKGFLWVGTSEGLNRFDGHSFKIFRNDLTDSNSISGNAIWKIFETKQGDLWIGTYTTGLNFYERRTGKFFRYGYDPNNQSSLSNNIVSDICEDGYGNLWIGTYNGLNKVVSKTGQPKPLAPYDMAFKRYNHQANDPRSLTNDMVLWVRVDSSGLPLVGMRGGVDQYVLSLDGFVHHANDPRAPAAFQEYPTPSFEDSRKIRWKITKDGLNRYAKGDSNFTLVWHRPENEPYQSAGDGIYEDSKLHIWIREAHCVLKIDPMTLRVTNYQLSSDMGGRTSLIEDKSGNMWFSSDNGLEKLSLNARQFKRFDVAGSTPQIRLPIFEDEGGELWGSSVLS